MSEGMYGLVGVIIGVMAGWLVPFFDRGRKRKRDAQYLAIRVVCILDRYVVDCADACNERLEMDDYGTTHVASPAPKLASYPEDVDWSCIEHTLMYAILSLPRDVELASDYLFGYLEHSAGSIDEYAAERATKYGGLGLQAAAICDKLRGSYSIPTLEHENWDPVQYMKDERKRREKEKTERAKPDVNLG